MRWSPTMTLLVGLLSAGIFATPSHAQLSPFGNDPQRGYYPPGSQFQGRQHPSQGQVYQQPFWGAYPQGREFSPWPPTDRGTNAGYSPQYPTGREFSPLNPENLGGNPFGSDLFRGLGDNLYGGRSITQPPLPPGAGPAGPAIYQRGYAGPVGPSPSQASIAGLADQLAAQADEFLQAFSLDARKVPQGALFLADATTLRNSAMRFRDITSSGAPPDILASEFRSVSASWEQFEGRMAFVSRGRIGPNIATALQMGQTVEQIARLLY